MLPLDSFICLTSIHLSRAIKTAPSPMWHTKSMALLSYPPCRMTFSLLCTLTALVHSCYFIMPCYIFPHLFLLWHYEKRPCLYPEKPRKAPDTQKGCADYQLIKLVLSRLAVPDNPFWSVLCSYLELSLGVQGGLVPGNPNLTPTPRIPKSVDAQVPDVKWCSIIGSRYPWVGIHGYRR